MPVVSDISCNLRQVPLGRWWALARLQLADGVGAPTGSRKVTRVPATAVVSLRVSLTSLGSNFRNVWPASKVRGQPLARCRAHCCSPLFAVAWATKRSPPGTTWQWRWPASGSIGPASACSIAPSDTSRHRRMTTKPDPAVHARNWTCIGGRRVDSHGGRGLSPLVNWTTTVGTYKRAM
jgi:hypothetical protein